LIGVFVVAAIVVVIATTTGGGETNPEVTERPSVNIEMRDPVTVVRKGGGQADWLCDLWLAERLAEC
jgi:hypothetical protein